VTIAGAGGFAAWFALLPAAALVCLLIVSTPHVYEAKRQLGWSSWLPATLPLQLPQLTLEPEPPDFGAASPHDGPSDRFGPDHCFTR
jgi:hypothetical protein